MPVSRLRMVRVVGVTVITLFFTFGVGLSMFAFIGSTWVAAPVMVIMGVGNGFIGVTLTTVVQRKTPEAMLARVMSLVMLAMFAMMPVSQALAGFVVGFSFEALYIGAGAGMVLLGLVSLSRPEVRRFGEVGMEPVSTPSVEAAVVSA